LAYFGRRLRVTVQVPTRSGLQMTIAGNGG